MWLLIFAYTIAWASIDQAQCTAKELRARDCHLRLAEYQLDVLDRTVAWTNGTWHFVDPMPLTGAGVEWEAIKFRKLGAQRVLEFWLWDRGAGESTIQSLHWFVTILGERNLKRLGEAVVRRRHPQSTPGKYTYDKEEAHALRLNSDGVWKMIVGGVVQTITP